MKLLILSDIHSNPACLEAILEAEADADAIYCAGDLVDYGPDPAAVIELAQTHNIHSVCGNHDRRVVRLWKEWDRQTPQTGLRWAQHNIQKLETAFSQSTQQPAATGKTASVKTGSAENVTGQENPYYQYLKSLPRFLSFTADGIAYLMTHQYGDEYETIESAWHFNQFWNQHFDLPICANMPRRMIFGHTHRQMEVVFGHTHRQMQVVFADPQGITFGNQSELLWLNPGSASYRRPDEPSKDAFYTVIEDGHIQMKRLPYDRRPIYDQVLAVQDLLDPDELRVAQFFFGWTEVDGPDYDWISYIKSKE